MTEEKRRKAVTEQGDRAELPTGTLKYRLTNDFMFKGRWSMRETGRRDL